MKVLHVVRVNRHTTARLFRPLRAAIYQAHSTEPIALGFGDIVEGGEAYIPVA